VSEAQLPTGGQATPSVRPYRPFAALALARRTDPLLFLFFLCRFVAGLPSPPLASPSPVVATLPPPHRNLNFSGIDSSIATRALTGSPASLPPTAAALLPLHVASFAW